jgi:4'-phosphopantetheinyl transferase
MIDNGLHDGWTAPPADLQLSEGHVHVWMAHLGRLRVDRDAVQRTLSSAENRRAAAFRYERDRVQFLRSHCLLRCLLAGYLRTAPPDVQITARELGKPALGGGTPLTFNVSHAKQMALYAFASRVEVGVDIESNRRTIDVAGITERYFTPAEIHAIAREVAGRRLRAFFRCWVRKEAVLKAAGCGLGIPLRDVDVAGDLPDGSHTIARVPGCGTTWYVSDLPPIRGYSAALAVGCAPRNVSCWRISPGYLPLSTCQ